MGKNYINNKEFEEVIQLYIKNKSDLELEARLFEMFDLLISNLYHSFNFSIDEEEAKQECLVLVTKVLSNFDREAGTAFNYFTTVILNNMKLMFTKEKKYKEKLEIYSELIRNSIDAEYYLEDILTEYDEY